MAAFAALTFVMSRVDGRRTCIGGHKGEGQVRLCVLTPLL